MSALTQQLSLPLEKHRNHYLFSDYYLDHLLPRRLDWQEATSSAGRQVGGLRVLLIDMSNENVAGRERCQV